jgi:HSP20 family protein
MDPFGVFHHEESPFSIVDRWFKYFLDDAIEGSHDMKSFPIDLYEDDVQYIAKAALPGFNKEDVSIEFENNILTIKASAHKECKNKSCESSYQSYVTRSISIPDGITPDKIVAKYDNGILSISIPKLAIKKPSKINIA